MWAQATPLLTKPEKLPEPSGDMVGVETVPIGARMPSRSASCPYSTVARLYARMGGPVQPSFPDETIYDYGHASRFYAKVILKRLLGDPPRSVDCFTRIYFIQSIL